MPGRCHLSRRPRRSGTASPACSSTLGYECTSTWRSVGTSLTPISPHTTTPSSTRSAPQPTRRWASPGRTWRAACRPPRSSPGTARIPTYGPARSICPAERAVIIGNGNVAVDVARILLSDPEDLACTNIADHALKTLRTSKVREVVLLGRRGPEQAAFTRPEFLALQHLPGVRVVVDEHPEVRAAIAGAEPGSKAAVVSPSSADAQRTGNSSLRVGAVGVPHWRTPRRTPRRSRSGGLSRSRESSRSKTSPRSRRVMKKSLPRGVPCATAGHVPSDGHHQHGHSPADDTVAQGLPGDAPGLLGP